MTIAAPGKRPRQGDAGVRAELESRAKSDWPTVPATGAAAGSLEGPELFALLQPHDGPHRLSKLEWWYVNGHSGDCPAAPAADGACAQPGRLSFFAAFFRLSCAIDGSAAALAAARRHAPTHAVAVNWAVVDRASGEHRTFGFVERDTPAIYGAMLERGHHRPEKFVGMALADLFRRGEVLAPDCRMATAGTFGTVTPPTAAAAEAALAAARRATTAVADLAADCLDLDFDGCTLRRVPLAADAAARHGGPARCGGFAYELTLAGFDSVSAPEPTSCGGAAAVRRTAHELRAVVVPTKPPVLHGTAGTVSMGPLATEDDMFYYLYPRCAMTGTFTSVALPAAPPAAARPVTAAAAREAVAAATGNAARRTALSGEAWIDHEFGGAIPTTPAEFDLVRDGVERRGGSEYAWEWAAVQLDNDAEVSLAVLTDPVTRKPVETFAVLREGSGAAVRLGEAAVTLVADTTATWTSPATGLRFPTAFDVTVELPGGRGRATLRLEAAVKTQEFVTLAAKPSYWEGHAGVTGTWGAGGAPVKGHGFIECNGLAPGDGAAAVYALLDTLLVRPLAAQILANPPPAAADAAAASAAAAGAAPAVDPAHFQVLCAPAVETAAAMAAAQAPAGTAPPTDAQKQFTADALAAYLAAAITAKAVDSDAAAAAAAGGEAGAVHRRKKAAAAAAAASAAGGWLSRRWDALRGGIPNDFQRLLLHSWAIRLVASSAEEVDEPAAAAAGAADAHVDACDDADGGATVDTAFDIPGGGDAAELERLLSTPPTPDVVAAAAAALGGRWRLDKPVSQPLGPLLSAQGVGVVVRKLTDRLQPTLETEVTAEALRTLVKTQVSSQEVRTRIDGQPTEWFSSGRGDLVTRAALLEGGRCLYCLTPVPPGQAVALEHKWLRRVEGPAAPVVVEQYRYEPSDGREPVVARRQFKRLDA